MNASILGYKHFHECTKAPEDVMARALAGVLTKAGAAADIGALIVASADARLFGDRSLLPRLMEKLGLLNALPVAITAQECTGLLSAIDLGCRYVRDGTCRKVLVVSYDRAAHDTQRIRPFGVVSDAAAACFVGAGDTLDYRVLGFALRSDLAGMRGNDDFDNRRALAIAVTNEVLSKASASLAEVNKAFGTNFYKPLAMFNAAAIGLTEAQVYAGRAAEVGHCLCADPLINLAEFDAQSSAETAGQRYLLQAYAPGFLASMLLERRACQVSSADRLSVTRGAGDRVAL